VALADEEDQVYTLSRNAISWVWEMSFNIVVKCREKTIKNKPGRWVIFAPRKIT